MFKRTQKKEFGQALTEMAISMPVLILILSGLLDLGRIYYTYIALEEAAAEAALYLAVEPDCPSDTDPDGNAANGNPCADPNNALYRASTAGNQEFDAALAEWNIPYVASPDFTDPFIECGGSFPAPNVGIGCVVIVQLSYPYEFITPGIEAIADGVTGGGLDLFVQATQIVIFE